MLRFALRCSAAATVALLAATGCPAPEEGFAFAEVTGTTDLTTLPDPDTESESSSETETGGEEPESFAGMRFIVTGSNPALMIAVNLDDPVLVPEPDTIYMGEVHAGIFDETPWGARVVTRDGMIEQLRIDGAGEYQFSPLAILPGNWIDSVWFDEFGDNAMMSVSDGPGQAPNQLFWLRYNNGVLDGTINLTPEVGENGVVTTLGRTPDGTIATVVIDSEPDDTWQMYTLPVLPEIGMSEQINQATLPGVPGQNVPAFLWTHLDNERVAFRKELLPNTLRPAAVPLDDPTVDPVNLAPSLPGVSSMVWSDDNSSFLATSGGGGSFRELDLIIMDGAVSALDPIEITTPDQLALNVVRPPLGLLNQGHGFDSMGRIFYAYTTDGSAAEGIQLITIAANNLAGRQDIANVPPAVEIDMMAYDPLTQMLGFRVLSSGSSWISYVDMSQQNPEGIRVDQFFDHDELEPSSFAGFAFAPDRSVIAVVGEQSDVPVLFTAQLGDDLGETTQITMPNAVEESAGVSVENTPLFSPDSTSMLLWYRATNDRRGLLQAPTSGERPFEVVINLEYDLVTGEFMAGDTPDDGAGDGDGDG